MVSAYNTVRSLEAPKARRALVHTRHERLTTLGQPPFADFADDDFLSLEGGAAVVVKTGTEIPKLGCTSFTSQRKGTKNLFLHEPHRSGDTTEICSPPLQSDQTLHL